LGGKKNTCGGKRSEYASPPCQTREKKKKKKEALPNFPHREEKEQRRSKNRGGGEKKSRKQEKRGSSIEREKKRGQVAESIPLEKGKKRKKIEDTQFKSGHGGMQKRKGTYPSYGKRGEDNTESTSEKKKVGNASIFPRGPMLEKKGKFIGRGEKRTECYIISRGKRKPLTPAGDCKRRGMAQDALSTYPGKKRKGPPPHSVVSGKASKGRIGPFYFHIS